MSTGKKDHQLIMFYSGESSFTRRAAPCVATVEEKLGSPLFKLEATENEYNKMLYGLFNPSFSKCHGCTFDYAANHVVNVIQTCL